MYGLTSDCSTHYEEEREGQNKHSSESYASISKNEVKAGSCLKEKVSKVSMLLEQISME